MKYIWHIPDIFQSVDLLDCALICGAGDDGWVFRLSTVVNGLSGSLWHCGNGQLSTAGTRWKPNTVGIYWIIFQIRWLIKLNDNWTDVQFLCYLLPVTSCAFVSNLNETSEAPNLQMGQKIMQSMLEADLVMNVHRDGQWGAFRHQLLTNGTTLLLIQM